MFDFNMSASLEETKKISKISALAVKENPKLDHLDTMMYLTACHLNGTPLDLDRMITSDVFNLMHDVYGINRHLNRSNGKIEEGFLPRYYKKETE